MRHNTTQLQKIYLVGVSIDSFKTMLSKCKNVLIWQGLPVYGSDSEYLLSFLCLRVCACVCVCVCVCTCLLFIFVSLDFRLRCASSCGVLWIARVIMRAVVGGMTVDHALLFDTRRNNATNATIATGTDTHDGTIVRRIEVYSFTSEKYRDANFSSDDDDDESHCAPEMDMISKCTRPFLPSPQKLMVRRFRKLSSVGQYRASR